MDINRLGAGSSTSSQGLNLAQMNLTALYSTPWEYQSPKLGGLLFWILIDHMGIQRLGKGSLPRLIGAIKDHGY